ncbi:tRNA lysidine(34) synthetase TilS [Candidatus Cardinium hertigii]|jgi:tRNA(Ile)-lysidine synthase|uniref:tRNA(Ile)-lysidine synthase n=1 Tax=Candidatus Cardinium hertigii TaxID=247481 RepID=A0A3N2QC58_9BACT|nr:tRNA lysidine(34) synthetase TilS [Candidatus Cardinium hertigii]ROT47351.1 tRNA lysidine(34) synthetase TilS [Candidatus Cardinium hertigii]
MLASFLSFLQSQQLIPDPQKTTLLAVSGGVDSVVLCHLFKQANLPFAIAYCNFNLRGQEVEEESQFVNDLAQHYQVPCYSTRFETKSFASTHKVSIQMAARTLRYQYFYTLLDRYGWDRVATAHHWDDAVETIVLNFIKGTGIKGFYSMLPLNGRCIRPLLFARKKEIIAYAQQEKRSWREDSSNTSLDYQRNFIRHKIIPLVHQINPNFEATTQETVEKLTDVGRVFQDYVNNIKKDICFFKGDIHYIAINLIAALPWAATVAFELVRSYGFTFKQIKNLINTNTTTGKIIYATDYALYIDRKNWLIRKKQLIDQLPKEQAVEANTRLCYCYNHTFYFRKYTKQDYSVKKIALIAALHYDMLQFPLTIRPWKHGDIFYPLGMQGRKKISDLLIDLKVPMAIKEQVLVVTSNHKIVWVVGYRIDERFKVDDHTATIFEIAVSLAL